MIRSDRLAPPPRFSRTEEAGREAGGWLGAVRASHRAWREAEARRRQVKRALPVTRLQVWLFRLAMAGPALFLWIALNGAGR